MCQAFDFRLARKYSDLQVIGSTPIIENRRVLRRMSVYGCASRPEQKYFDAPQQCYTSSPSCPELMNFWRVGEEGECFKNAGFMVNSLQLNYVLLQVHWRNVDIDNGETDSSGFTLYLTQSLRKNFIGSAMYGEVLFELPPQRSLVSVQHTCPSECTESNQQDVRDVRKIMAAGLCMHEYAVRGQVSLLRKGSLVRILVPMARYTMAEQKLIRFDPPVEFRNGDEIKTECYYNTADSSTPVRSGYRRDNEMCIGFISYYPSTVYILPENRMDRCFSYAGIHACRAKSGSISYIEDGCDIRAVQLGIIPKIVDAEMTRNKCYMGNVCSPECMIYLQNGLWPSNPCYKPGRVLRMMRLLATGKFLESYEPATKELIMRTLTGQEACIKQFEIPAVC